MCQLTSAMFSLSSASTSSMREVRRQIIAFSRRWVAASRLPLVAGRQLKEKCHGHGPDCGKRVDQLTRKKAVDAAHQQGLGSLIRTEGNIPGTVR